MTAPDAVPSVSTAPAEGASPATTSPRAPLGRRRLPPHLGPARTSTVLLALAFVAIGVLYLFVKPPELDTAGSVPDPSPTRSVGPTTSAPAPTPPEESPTPEDAPASTSETEPTPSTTPSTTPEDGTGEETETPTPPEDPTEPEPTPSEPAPTTTAPST